MKLMLIQLSDIHLKANVPNPVLQRKDAITRAIGPLCPGAEHALVVVSGDSAFSGKMGEFAHAKDLIEAVRAAATAVVGTPAPVVTVPGNHDCDFERANSTRDVILGNAANLATIDDSIIANCTVVQDSYFDFARDIEGVRHEIGGIDRLHRLEVRQFGDRRVSIHLLNSAWLSQKREVQGKLYFPVDAVRGRIETAEVTDLCIAVIHHPFNWYGQENARQLRNCLEENTDLVLTGHEHVAASFQRVTDFGDANAYLEAGVLQQSDAPDVSSFNVVIFDLSAGTQETHRLDWKGDHYAPVRESALRPFARNRRRLRGSYDFTTEFKSELDDPGADYSHPHKEQLTLRDFFVYPDLSEVTQKRSNQRTLIGSGEVVSYVLDNPMLFLTGEERSGKTSIARSLVRDLHSHGKVPILLNGADLDHVSDDKRLQKAAQRQIAAQYGDAPVDPYWQMDPTLRVAVVDDLHKIGGNHRAKERLADLLRHRFGSVVLIGSDELRFEEIVSSSQEPSILWTFKSCRIVQFGFVLRSALVKKWCRLGRAFTAEEADLNREVDRLEKTVTRIISTDLLPSVPAFILILLQHVEANGQAANTSTSGSFGYLYEVLITASLARRRDSRIDIDTKYNYLSELAYALFAEKVWSAPEVRMRDIHRQYCLDYQIDLDFDYLIKGMVEAAIIERRHGTFRFRYKYLYYFFVARFFRDHITEESIQAQIRVLSESLQHDDSANIMIFLCHLSKSEGVLAAMLVAARSQFTALERFDIVGDAGFLNRLASPALKLALQAKNPEANRLEMNKRRDERAGVRDSSRTDDETISPAPQRSSPNDINVAFKTIQILGQVLRNFTGSLRGDRKYDLVDECYGLGLRLLRFVFGDIETHISPLFAGMETVALSRMARPDEDRAQIEAQRAIYSLMQLFAYAVFTHVSSSVGSEKAVQTFADVVSNATNPGIKLIDLAIQLEHYRGFPEARLEELMREFKGSPFAKSIVMLLVWTRFYIFDDDYRLKQRICQLLEIGLDKPFFDQKAKRFGGQHRS